MEREERRGGSSAPQQPVSSRRMTSLNPCLSKTMMGSEILDFGKETDEMDEVPLLQGQQLQGQHKDW